LSVGIKWFDSTLKNPPHGEGAKTMQTVKELKTKRNPLFKCMECGKKFYSVTAAENAAWNGCPKCNGGDIEVC